MNLTLIVWWALVGWCGTPWPRRWPFPPPPSPDPWILKVVNIIGGIAGGWAFSQMFPIGDASIAVAAAVTSIGALVGSVLLGDIYGFIRAPQMAGR